jgi:NAD(P)-dependent dehydrogenase (short-subunit alcohol dehydrogenase family)
LATVALDERVVLVTGATGILGRAVVGRFAAAGARLGLVGTHLDRLTEVADELGLADDHWAPGIGAPLPVLGRSLGREWRPPAPRPQGLSGSRRVSRYRSHERGLAGQ